MSDAINQRRLRMFERLRAEFEAPYDPNIMPKPDMRVSLALEYMAFQMGQINRNLARLVDHLEKKG